MKQRRRQRVHRTTSAQYGFARDNFCGTTSQPNPWTDRWVDFDRDARVGHMMQVFGGFSPRVFDAYDEAFPLEAGLARASGTLSALPPA